MPLLHDLERKLLERLPKLDLRPTLDRAAEVGDLLISAKAELPHGEYLPWLRRIGLNRKTAHDYILVAQHVGDANVRPAGHLTLKQFLSHIRKAKKADKILRLRHEPQTDAEAQTHSAELVLSDCRAVEWPPLDAVATDPPWADLDAYRWLAEMCSARLVEGGAALVQVGTPHVPAVLGLFTAAGLTYRWMLAVAYKSVGYTRPLGMFRPLLKPVLVFTKGPHKFRRTVTDLFMAGPARKDLHQWSQPAEPWVYWLGRLLRPGSLVGDPFAGSGTIGIACRRSGLKYIGSEIDRQHHASATERLARWDEEETP